MWNSIQISFFLNNEKAKISVFFFKFEETILLFCTYLTNLFACIFLKTIFLWNNHFKKETNQLEFYFCAFV